MHDCDLLVVEKLRKYFPVGGGLIRKPSAYVKAVEDVSLTVKNGETFGLVGESGCGKTTLGRCILRLIEPTAGRILFNNQDILSYNSTAMRRVRRDMQIIFQDPYSSLDPRKTVTQILSEPFSVHRMLTQKERRERVAHLMSTVGLHPEHAHRYPHEFSGGQRQRICVARALALQPQLIIADEPSSSLDVSIQAQILNLLVQLQNQFSLSYIFISHDLRVIRHISDRVAVMYLGRIVELARSNTLFAHPFHPYTEALISALPFIKPGKKKNRIILEGDVPSPIHPPSGCSFHPRCKYYEEMCTRQVPPLAEVEDAHRVACYFPRR